MAHCQLFLTNILSGRVWTLYANIYKSNGKNGNDCGRELILASKLVRMIMFYNHRTANPGQLYHDRTHRNPYTDQSSERLILVGQTDTYNAKHDNWYKIFC